MSFLKFKPTIVPHFNNSVNLLLSLLFPNFTNSNVLECPQKHICIETIKHILNSCFVEILILIILSQLLKVRHELFFETSRFVLRTIEPLQSYINMWAWVDTLSKCYFGWHSFQQLIWNFLYTRRFEYGQQQLYV